MKKILLFIMLCVCTGAKAQCQCDSINTYYCVIMYGANGEGILKDPMTTDKYHIQDGAGTSITFSSSLAIINYMANFGWSYVSPFTDEDLGSYRKSYLLKKKSSKPEGLFEKMKLKKL